MSNILKPLPCLLPDRCSVCGANPRSLTTGGRSGLRFLTPSEGALPHPIATSQLTGLKSPEDPSDDPWILQFGDLYREWLGS